MSWLTIDQRKELVANARAIVAPGKGILAADESTGTIGKRFEGIKVENIEENRRAYRELLFTSGEDFHKYISGVIMYEETLGQKTADGVPFVELLQKQGILPGIKVDKGLVTLPGTNNETDTTGLDGLAERCKKYYQQGARFAKWRNVINVSDKIPTELSVQANAFTLARYAVICQQNGLVPIVEPEVLMDGSHDLERALEVTTHVLATVYKALHDHHVFLEGTLLKPNMVLPGSDSGVKHVAIDIAIATVTALQRTVPAAVPGIVFLSGGQSEEEATLNLNAINALEGAKPWKLSFSYGRALQSSTLKSWKGDKANVEEAKKIFLVRAKANSEAQLGKYAGGAGGASAAESLFQKNYKY